ncbi:hypothetical protein TNIN_433511 [Trichonephila inaurata madagascariensis]|uniref:Uncharacterized protein n=1 Tax=Trichonephila inaurata madagascariensis TaxID=2747483 RepID=A0A8X7BV17_9ARAC|nr:hypothetical protein TNIN_433511 [Trichonephila inaurata madagascariensis]
MRTNGCPFSHADDGIYRDRFFFYAPIGIYSTALDAEIDAIRIAFFQLLRHTDRFSKGVILNDIRANRPAISSIEAPTSVSE